MEVRKRKANSAPHDENGKSSLTSRMNTEWKKHATEKTKETRCGRRMDSGSLIESTLRVMLDQHKGLCIVFFGSAFVTLDAVPDAA
mmetsp:Transcript_108453/g.305749  ORF Transcript_108453/g.305749 Transcript_108453/m.305749 type:complete len:86 (+) Transcript_108453:63-320(+)